MSNYDKGLQAKGPVVTWGTFVIWQKFDKNLTTFAQLVNIAFVCLKFWSELSVQKGTNCNSIMFFKILLPHYLLHNFSTEGFYISSDKQMCKT